MITSAWIDTETTGIDPRDAGAFEIALLIYQGSERVFEKLYHLNPLDEEVKWSEEACRVNGVTEETIRSYPPLEKVASELIADLKQRLPEEKYVFAGYNCPFDYRHIAATFFRAGFLASDYFNKRLIDVYALVKRAMATGLVPNTRDRKLETMTKALGVIHDAAHTAMDDIKATRRLYETLYFLDKKAARNDFGNCAAQQTGAC
jgi:DNA polymerase III epsilon subunit-like protein